MGKPKRKKKSAYNYDINRKLLNKKRKKLPAIQCLQMKEAWDRNSSVIQNFYEMGLSVNPNKTIKIPKVQEALTPMEIDGKHTDEKVEKKAPKKEFVAKALEAFANRPLLKTFTLPNQELEYVKYMIDKHGGDYKAMAKDPRNHYQDTPKQLRQKVKRYHKSRSKFKDSLEARSSEKS